MKKREIRRALCVLLTCALALASVFPAFAGTPAEDAHLHFNADGKFRVLNFSDIQDDETLDSRAQTFLRRAVVAAQPDLIVLTGDNIYGNHVSSSKTQTAIAQFMDIFESLGVPVAIVFGNHDDQGGTSKETQMRYYNSYSVSISYDEGSSMAGCGTYNVPIYGSTETDKVKFNLWMFDTGSDTSVSGYDYMRANQLNWYVNKSNELKAANGGKLVPSIAFQHIIVKEIFSALRKVSSGTSGAVKYDGNYYVLPDTAAPGSVLNEHPCPSKYGDEFATVKQQGDVLAIVSGHDHINQFIVPYQGIDLINSPGIGYYAYGDDELRGARILDLDEQTGTYTTEMLLLQDLAQPQYYIQTSGSTRYVKNVAVCVAQSVQYGGTENAKNAAFERVYAAVGAAGGNGIAMREDLNGGSTNDTTSGNHYAICMGYTLTDDPGEAMRGFGLCYTSSSGASGAQYDGAASGEHVWRLCNNGVLLVGGTDGAVDLNAGTSGNAIYFVGDYNASGGEPITEIRIVNTGSDSISMSDYSGYRLASAVVGSSTGTSYADLNKTARGDYVYALYKTASDGMSRVQLDSQSLRVACFDAGKLLKSQPAAIYSPQSYAALLNAVHQAQDVILRDLDDDRQTTVYDQAALERAAHQIRTCMQNLEPATIEVTLDAGAGTCAVPSCSVRYGEACGTLPTASRNRYVLDGWFTEPDGGERITASTPYTSLSGTTWYAHWIKDPDWLAGDADQDNRVDLRDVTAILRHLAGGWNVQVEFDYADVNADGKIDLRDVTLLRRYLAGGWGVELI